MLYHIWKFSLITQCSKCNSDSCVHTLIVCFDLSKSRRPITCSWNIYKKTHSIYMSREYFSYINPFPHIDTFWRLCSRRLFENIVTKEEIAQNEQFLLLPQCFPLFVIGYPFNYRDILFFDKICSKSSAAKLSYEGKKYIQSRLLQNCRMRERANTSMGRNDLILSRMQPICSRRL